MAGVFKAGFWQSGLPLGEREEVRWWCGARRVERWAARGGRLILTTERLTFLQSNWEKHFVRRWPDTGKSGGGGPYFSSTDRDWATEIGGIEGIELTRRKVSFRTIVSWNWRAGVRIRVHGGGGSEFIVRGRDRAVSELTAWLGLEPTPAPPL